MCVAPFSMGGFLFLGGEAERMGQLIRIFNCLIIRLG